MSVNLIRAKTGIHVPANPEDESSVTKFVQSGLLTIVPENFKLPKESFDIIQRVDLKKEKVKKEK